MEHFYDKVPVETKDDGRTSGSATPDFPLLESERNTSTLVEGSSDSHARDQSPRSFDFHAEHQYATNSKSPLWDSIPITPITALVLQLIMLIGMTFFVVWTSVSHRPVPSIIGDLYIKYPQTSATVLTLIGSVLSLINSMLFAEAVRFAIHVSLRSRSLSLYSLSAATTIASRAPLFRWNGGRINWTATSILCFSVFTVQTSAWSTIFTPRLTLISYLETFIDVDFASHSLMTGSTAYDFMPIFLQSSGSGIAAAQAVNIGATSYLPYTSHVLVGTSRGILPIPSFSYFMNSWTRIETLQHGLTANVSCNIADGAMNSSKVTSRAFDRTYVETILYCDGSTSSTDLNSPVIFDEDAVSYIAFTVCPYWQMDNPDNSINLYMQMSRHSTMFDNFPNVTENMICNIKPQLLNVAVAYNNSGFVTVESFESAQIELPVNASSAVHSVITALEYNLSSAQSSDRNIVVDAIYALFGPNYEAAAEPQLGAPELVAGYIQGVIEDAGTALRYMLVSNNTDPNLLPLTGYAQVVVWGQVSLLKLSIIIAPMIIMIATISILLLFLYRARTSGLKLDMFFDPMDTLHILSACSAGNLQSISFPDYCDDTNVFCKDVEVHFPEGRTRNNVEGFYFCQRR